MLSKVCVDLGISAEGASDALVSGRDGPEDTGGQEEAETESVSPKQSSDKAPAPSGFTVLGGFESKPVQKVQSLHAGTGLTTSMIQFPCCAFECFTSFVCRFRESCLSGSLSLM